MTFFRSMGGTLGAAVFLSVLFSVLPGKIKDAFTAAQTTPEFQAGAARPPRPGAGAPAGRSRRQRRAFNDTSFLNRLADALAHPFKVGFSDAIELVFLIGAGHHGRSA